MWRPNGRRSNPATRPPAPCPPQECMAVKSEAVAEAVPENVKNMLLVLAAGGVLTPDWKVGGL